MAGLQFSFSGNNKNLLKNIAQVQNALATMTNELESNGENFTNFFDKAAKSGIDLTKALSGDSKEISKLAETMKANLKEMQAAWDNLTDEMKQSSLGKVMGASLQEANQMSDDVIEKLNNHGKQVNKTTGEYNGLAVQVQMLAREVPNLANSFQIFMMAIGNNLPMLADELSKANEEIKQAKEAGESFTPVWKQAIKAVFNWQTAIILGVTALTAWGDKIPDIIKKISGMNKALLDTKEMQEAINNTMKENSGGYAEQLAKLNKLQIGWKNLGSDLEKQKKFIVENKDAFDDLGVSVTSVKDAENLFVENTDAFIVALDKRAQAEASYQLAIEQYKKMNEANLKAKQAESEGVSFGDKAKAAYANIGLRESGLQGVTAKQVHEERIQGYKDEAEAAETLAKSYLGVSEAQEKEAESALKNAGIKEKENEAQEKETERLEKLAQAKAEYNRKSEELEQARKGIILKAQKAATDAMEEGYAKQEKQLKDAHQSELNELEKQKAEYLQKKIELAKAKAEASGTKFDASKIGLTTEETKVFDSTMKDTQARQAAEIEAFKKTIADMTKAAQMAEKTQLEQQLYDIDTYYSEAIKKAEGFEELKTQLSKNWAAERARAENEARLRENQRSTDTAVMKADSTYFGTGLTEKAEQEKTKILIKYTKERIAILKELGDEQSQAEAENLANQIELYEKQLKQPMSVKGWLDSKIFDKLEKQYIELGKTQEEAEGKAAEFFVGLKNGATQVTDAVSLLQTAFGGLDENVDKALNAIGSIANGFASGGLAGGIAATTGVIMQTIKSLGAADYSQYEALKKEYEGLLDVWDKLIDKKTEYVDIDFGDEARKSGDEALEIINKQKEAYEELGKARLSSGGGWFSHTIGVKQRKGMSDKGWEELAQAAKEIGFNYDAVASGKMKGLFDLTGEQLAELQEKAPTFWAKLDNDVKGYLENIIACQEQIEQMQNQLNEATTGVSFDAFYDNFVSTLSDMESDSEDFSEDFGNYLKNAIMRNLIANKYRGQIESLYNSWVSKSDTDKNGVFDLTTAETKELQDAQKALSDAMIAERDALASTFGWLTGESYSQEASSKGFQSMNQETGDELNGRFTAFQMSNEAISVNTKQIAETINLVLAHLPNFDAVLNDMLTQHANTNMYLEDISKYTKTIKDFGAILQQIADNTKNL